MRYDQLKPWLKSIPSQVINSIDQFVALVLSGFAEGKSEPNKEKKMKTLYIAAKLNEDKGKFSASGYGVFSTHEKREDAVAKIRQAASNDVGTPFGLFTLEGTVTHPIPELDVTPVT